ncbi:hypothetical protein H5395_17035 [Paracoccus sp. MC1854]|uniref:hypothetical protein n=1 Tax=Paracoccus sp. MC1854 TaxID=2760306 RepID=UPI0016005A8F|nr:hypothetical protein [Paracoccus sp. MC1854]MBB1493170.1 hypothetical protein [Paracoccus sp. MC1854]
MIATLILFAILGIAGLAALVLSVEILILWRARSRFLRELREVEGRRSRVGFGREGR